VFDTSGRSLRQHVLPPGDHWLHWDAWIDRTTGHVSDTERVAAKPPIVQLSIDEHGRLWVQRALAPGASATT
jgi:hypothetical protein